MTARRPTIVVSLPARSATEARIQVAEAARAGADCAELRFDRWSREELARVESLFPSPLPLVATYRSREEGGEGESALGGRRAVLLDLARWPFRWIDLELARDLELLPELPPPERVGRIVSCHLARPQRGSWSTRLGELEGVDGVGKLVVASTVGEALRELLPEVGRLDGETVLLTTGPSGPLFRAWARRLGFPLVYAALPSSAGVEAVEPSQIAVDRLLPYLDAEEPPPLFAVCGRPVAHSRSPALHAAWMRDDQRRGLYLALEFADDREFLDALEPLAEGGFRGLNVTHPFKTVAAEAATDAGPGVRACGAANCLTFDGGQVRGENTDLLAVLRRLQELRTSRRWDGRTLTIVGAGGAARATVAAARELGGRAMVVARRPERLQELARQFPDTVVPFDPGTAASLVVHATDVGRAVGTALEPPLEPCLGRDAYLLDWVYAAASPSVRLAAERAGATYEDGWRLLVYQAAASYEIWWGQPPPDASIERALAEGTCAA